MRPLDVLKIFEAPIDIAYILGYCFDEINLVYDILAYAAYDPIKHTLMYAAEGGHLELFQYLESKDKYKYIDKTLIHSIVYHKQFRILEHILSNNIYLEDNAATLIATYCGHVDVLAFLKDLGVNLHIDEDIILSIAAHHGHLNVLVYLVDVGINLDTYKASMLAKASEGGHLDIVKFLVEHGADVNCSHGRCLVLASSFGHFDIVKYLVEKGANIHAMSDLSFRCAAAYCTRLDIAKYLMEKGANIYVNDGEVLMYSIKWGQIRSVKFLVEVCNMDIHIQDDQAFRLAEEHGRTDILHYLGSKKNLYL